MAISVSQRPSGHDTGGLTGSVAVAFGSNNTAGNIIIAIGFISNNSNTALSKPTDTNSNTYSEIKSINDGSSSLGLKAWIAYNIAAGANTVTMLDGNNIAGLHLYEVAGLSGNSAFDLSVFQYQSSATACDSTTTARTSAANELLIGCFANTHATSQTYTIGGGYSNIVNDGLAFLSTATEEQIVSAHSTYNATATLPANADIELSALLTFSDTPLPIPGTTTSTSSTSASSTSISSTSTSATSTSTSISTSSTSISSTSSSLSTSSTSLSTSSTSSSISSTSSSTSSTSMSSTSSSTSISSTSSSISSTSQSSTSISSTSSSTSLSSTSSSFSSTSSSQSSTSSSTSSTSFSSTSSSSSTSSTTLPPPYLDYSYQDSLTLPTTGSDLTNPFTTSMYSDVSVDDGDYFIEYGSEYMIRNYQRQGRNNTDTPQFTWRGRTTVSTTTSPMLIQIYNVNSTAWETLAVANKVPADTDFSVTVSQTTNVSNYYDSRNIITFRSYQQVI